MRYKTIFEEIFSKTAFKAWICLFLVVTIVGIYSQVSHFDFINFDDDIYVFENRHVQSGLNRENIAWAFSYANKNNTYWHPLTWMSHMLDTQLYGMDPGRHHMINVLFHIASTVILFLIWHRMTGALWRSAFVAFLFASHPLNVESVVWVAERKNVLSTLFWMLTLFCYVYYAEKPNFTKYLLLSIVFVFGLLAKPMLVTLPFVLLLLDYWPLGRLKVGPSGFGQNNRRPQSSPSDFRTSNIWFLIVEKLPIFAVSVTAVFISSLSLQSHDGFTSLDDVTPKLRIANAIISCVKYMAKIIWPKHLVIFYPYPDTVTWHHVLGALVLLIGITAIVLWFWKKKPYLLVGWLWFLGTLIPVSGLMQAGLWPAVADRWAYVPTIGLFIMIAWIIPDLSNLGKTYRVGFGVTILVVLSILISKTWIQIRYWKNGIEIFQHAISINPHNWLAHSNLGSALAKQGDFINAYKHSLEAFRLKPDVARVQLNYGNALLNRGEVRKAAIHFEKALQLDPDLVEAHNNWGLALLREGKLKQSIRQFHLAAGSISDYSAAVTNLNLALSIYNKINLAVSNMQAALAFRLEDPDLEFKIKKLLTRKKELDQSLNFYQKTLSLQPGFARINGDEIPAVSVMKKNFESKLSLLQTISKRLPNSAETCYLIACIYSRQGKIHKSVEWIKKAIEKGLADRNLIKSDFDLENLRESSIYKNWLLQTSEIES